MKKFAETIERLLAWGGIKKDIVFLVISGAALAASLSHISKLPFDPAWIAILLCGVPILMEAFVGLITSFDIKADVLVSLALIASVLIGEDFAAGEVAFIMQIGGLLEELTVARARQGIERLLHLTPQTARRMNMDHTEEIIPADEVQKGDILRVLPGETIPVDGIIISGETSVNQAVMTGEALPVDKTAGDEVASGTVNQFGVFEMEAAKVGEDSSIQRMIRLVQSADAGKAKIVGLADRWATWIVVIALTASVLTWVISGEIIRAVTILVVFCPCALVLATPTAIMAAIGNATKHGFLIKEGDALERLAKVEKITFDKTGTITRGKLKVVEVKSVVTDITDHELYRYAASAESLSEHPLGKAVTGCYRESGTEDLYAVSQFHMIPGQGISAVMENRVLLAGNEKFLVSRRVIIPEKHKKEIEKCFDRGCTVILVSLDHQYAGYIALADTLRKDSAHMVKEIIRQKVTPVLLTGDNEKAAASIASQAGIAEVYAGCLPETKMQVIRKYQETGQNVCMIGDGVNDAPALKAANVGIAMGGVGSDIAVEAADIALVDDEMKELPHLLALSRRMMTTIKANLCFSIGLNFLAIILAITGVLNPVVGALVHNAGSVLVILNSALLLRWNRQ